MGIGDIGWSEFLFILVLALIFLGPRRLPEVANAIGRSLREFRRALNEVQDELRRETQIPSIRDGLWNRKFDAPIEPREAPPKSDAEAPPKGDAEAPPKGDAPEREPAKPEADRPDPPSSES